MTGTAGPESASLRAASARAFRQGLVLIVLSVIAGAVRQFLPNGVDWVGNWPTATTSAAEAYKLMAQPDDPPFASLAHAIAFHNGGAVFLDARAPAEFKEGHIPGARNLPFYEMDAHEKDALDGLKPGDRIVIYCEGVGCELSLFLGRELKARGYTELNIFYGGFPEWKGAGLEIEK